MTRIALPLIALLSPSLGFFTGQYAAGAIEQLSDRIAEQCSRDSRTYQVGLWILDTLTLFFAKSGGYHWGVIILLCGSMLGSAAVVSAFVPSIAVICALWVATLATVGFFIGNKLRDD